MLNKKMYQKLYHSMIESGEARSGCLSIYDVRRRAMVLKASTSLTKGEEKACQEVKKEADSVSEEEQDE